MPDIAFIFSLTMFLLLTLCCDPSDHKEGKEQTSDTSKGGVEGGVKKVSNKRFVSVFVSDVMPKLCYRFVREVRQCKASNLNKPETNRKFVSNLLRFVTEKMLGQYVM